MMVEKAKKTAKAEDVSNDLGTFNPLVACFPSNTDTNVQVYRLFQDVNIPEYGTKESACFDFKAFLGEELKNVEGYDARNEAIVRRIREDTVHGRHVLLNPGDRVKINTGLIFKLPSGHVMNLFVRSGVSLKTGMKLANSVAVIDSDYVDEIFLSVENTSKELIRILHNERIVQAEIRQIERSEFTEIKDRPAATTRTGGFGSTGAK